MSLMQETCSFQRTSKILMFPRKHKIYLFELTCDVLFIQYGPDLGMVYEINTTLAKMVQLKHQTRS